MAVWFLLIAAAVFAQTGKTFTLDELAKYNGKNGAKAYVAVNGTVYDVTGLPQWPQGKHFCPGSVAGTDITDLYQRSPHMKRSNYLARFPVVGTLVGSTQPAPSPSPLVSGSPLPTTNPQPRVGVYIAPQQPAMLIGQGKEQIIQPMAAEPKLIRQPAHRKDYHADDHYHQQSQGDHPQSHSQTGPKTAVA